MAFWLLKHLHIYVARFCFPLFFFVLLICSYYLDLGSCVLDLVMYSRSPFTSVISSTLIYHQSSAINNTLSEGSSTLIKWEWRNLCHFRRPYSMPTKYPSPPAIYPVAANSSRNVIPAYRQAGRAEQNLSQNSRDPRILGRGICDIDEAGINKSSSKFKEPTRTGTKYPTWIAIYPVAALNHPFPLV